MCTIFNSYVLRPFAIRDPTSLHQVVWHARDAGGLGFRWRDYEELSRRTDLFGAVVGEDARFVPSKGRALLTAFVSINYVDALGPAVYLGRGFGSIDADGPGNPAVLSHQAWTRLFDRDSSVIGQEVELNGQVFTIVGVLAPAFTGFGTSPRELFVPMRTAAAQTPVGADETRETAIFVRLQPGVSAVQAQRALTPLMNDIFHGHEDVRAEVRPQSSPNTLSVEVLAIFSPVFAAFLLVLVTTYANVSNVMLARAIARHREMAVRLSIGASRSRIVRQMLTEGLLISILAGLAGLGLAAAGLRVAMVALYSTLTPSVAPIVRLVPMTFDYRVFLFALVVSASATLLFALLPALEASRISLTDALRGQGGAARRGSRLRNALVVAQVTVALVLVITAVTLARNGAGVGRMDLGFDTNGVISVNVRGDQDQLARPLAEGLAADPRVAEVAVTSSNPLFNAAKIVVAGPADTVVTRRTRCTFVSPEFFSILQIPIARGRGFRIDEARSAAPVAIVSAATARAFWPAEDPIGKTIRIERPAGRSVDELAAYREVTVIGTVRDIVTGMLVQGHDAGHIYLPISRADTRATAVLVRGHTDRGLGSEVFQEIGALMGVAATFAVMKLLNAAIPLEAISFVDVGAFAAGLALIMTATVVAAYQPARRATRIDPSQTLRSDA